MHAKLKTIATLSAIGIVVPFLGIPYSWKMWISALLALVVGLVAYIMLAQGKGGSREGHVINEDAPFAEKQPEPMTQSEQSTEKDTYAP